MLGRLARIAGRVSGLTAAGDWIGDRWNDATGVTAGRDARRAMERGSMEADTLMREMYGQARSDVLPYQQAGAATLGDVMGRLDQYGKPYSGPTYQDPGFKDTFTPQEFNQRQFSFSMGDDPGVQYRMDMAQKAFERSAAARGGALGGGAIRGLNQEIQGLSSQEYDNAYRRARGAFESDRSASMANRNFMRDAYERDRSFGYGREQDMRGEYYDNIGDDYQRRMGIVGMGADAANNLAGNAMTLGGVLSQNRLGLANAQSAGRIGQYNSQRDFLMGLGGLAAKVYGDSTGRR